MSSAWSVIGRAWWAFLPGSSTAQSSTPAGRWAGQRAYVRASPPAGWKAMRRCQGRSVAGARRIHGDAVATSARSAPACAGEWAGAATSGGGALDGDAGAPCWTSAVRRAMASSMRERRASRGGAAAWLVDGAGSARERAPARGSSSAARPCCRTTSEARCAASARRVGCSKNRIGASSSFRSWQIRSKICTEVTESSPSDGNSSSGVIGRVARFRPSRMTRSR